MLRHIVPFILILALVLTGCSKGKPNDISEAHYKYGLKALEIVDEYLDFNITAKNAREKIDALTNESDSLPKTEFKSPDHAKNSGVEHEVTMLSYELLKIDNGSGTYDDLLEQRNELAELLNEKKR